MKRPSKYGLALLLTGHEDAVSIERVTLRQAGVLRVRVLHSGRQGLALLGSQPGGGNSGSAEYFDQPFDFVVCTENLSDMTGQAFLRELAATCRDLNRDLPPLLAVTSNKDSEAALLALGAGAVLVRPYAVTDLGDCLQLLAASSSKTLHNRKLADSLTVKSDEATLVEASPADSPVCLAEAEQPLPVTACKPGVFEAAPADSPEALHPLLHTRRGLALLRENKLDEAESLLRLALERDSLDLEACLGLTRLCRQLCDDAGEERWNTRAAVICLRSGQPERAEVFLSRLPQDTVADPFMAEARYLLQDGDYQGAAEAFLDLNASRPDIPLHELAARASLFTDCPEETLRELCAAYKRSGQDLVALQLYNRLLAHSDEELEPFDYYGQPGPFPIIQEVFAVMRFAASAWRNSAA